MCEQFEESYTERLQAMRGSIEQAVKDYDRIVFAMFILFDEKAKMTRVEKFVPELKQSKNIEGLEHMYFAEYDTLDLEHLYSFCKVNPINN